MVEGAKDATGIAVIIDVFRAFTVEAYLMNNGAEKLMPVGDMDIAYKYKEKNNNCVLVGERHGKILPGFDFGNSPSQIQKVDFTGKTVIHTTSAGTQGIANAMNADEVLTGSLVNAKAIAEYIKQKDPEEVSLVCMGLEAKSQTEEDNLCAYYIKSLLENKPMDLSEEIEKLKVTSGAKFFDKDKQDVFPEPDFYLSTEVNKFDFVLKVEKDEDGIVCLTFSKKHIYLLPALICAHYPKGLCLFCSFNVFPYGFREKGQITFYLFTQCNTDQQNKPEAKEYVLHATVKIQAADGNQTNAGTRKT